MLARTLIRNSKVNRKVTFWRNTDKNRESDNTLDFGSFENAGKKERNDIIYGHRCRVSFCPEVSDANNFCEIKKGQQMSFFKDLTKFQKNHKMS